MIGIKKFFLFFLMSLLSCDIVANKVMGDVNHHPFHEITLDDDGVYDLDVDFDGIDDKIIVDEYSNVTVLKKNKHGMYTNVSDQIPYSMIRIHRCCEAHRAYTTINYLQHSIYVEAHYGYSERTVRKFRKINDDWIEIYPIKPLSLLLENMFPPKPVGWIDYGSQMVWRWSYYYKHR